MLKSLRNNMKYYMFLFVLVGISFVFWVPGMGPDSQETEPLAIVGDEEITLEEFWRGYDNARDIYQEIYADKYDKAMEEKLKKDVLSSLVEARIFTKAAADAGVTVSDEEVSEAIMAQPSFQRDGVFNREVYLNTLRLNRLTPGYYENAKRGELLLRKMRHIYVSSVDLSPAELENVPEGNEFREALESSLLDEKQQGAILSFVNAYKSGIKLKVNQHLLL